MKSVYRSKVDIWLLLVLLFAIGIALFASTVTLASGARGAWLPLLITLVVGVGLPLWLLLGIRYVVRPQQLTVHSGPLKWKIPLADITAITPTSNALASPALSLDRLRIDYVPGKSIMISPRDKVRFINEIEQLRKR